MELGTAIFLSSIVLAVVILYVITKDRWRWRRIVKRAALACLCIIVLGTALGVGAYFWGLQLPQEVEPQTAYAGLRLGMTQEEVMYVKGDPPIVFDEGSMTKVDTKKLEKEQKQVTDFRDWSYSEYEREIVVTFNANRTAVTAIQCYSSKTYRCPDLSGVRDGDSENDVVRKLGKPTSSKIEGTMKEMRYRSLNIVIKLAKEQVYLVALRHPSHQR
jgi:hypothetical protein